MMYSICQCNSLKLSASRHLLIFSIVKDNKPYRSRIRQGFALKKSFLHEWYTNLENITLVILVFLCICFFWRILE